MLKVAATAAPEILTGRLSTPWSWSENLDNLTASEVGFSFDDSNSEPVAWCRSRDKDWNALETGQSIAASDEFFDLDLQLVHSS
jgi:hypothetical protein